MAGDITRTTFNPLKHYNAVRQQQGRVSVDADWNEQADIATYRVRTETTDVLGHSGAPRDSAGFQVVSLPLTGASTDLALSPGRMYVDGILCELEASLVPVQIVVNSTGAVQIDLTNMIVDGRELAAQQWVEVSATDPTAPSPVQTQIASVNVAGQNLTTVVSISGFVGKTGQQLRRITTYKMQPDSPSPAAPPASGLALAYLDVWERTVTALEDGEIRDPALGPASGPDTTTRGKTVWQVKLLPLASPSATCATASNFSSFQSTAQMAARSEPTAAATSACIIPPRAGYRRLENQLYRVEVHTPGTVAGGRPTFKWSRDNASIVTAIVAPAPVLTGTSLTLTVSSLGRDQVLGFATGQVVELTEDGRELAGQTGILVQLTGAAQGPQGPVLTASTALANPTDLANFLNPFTNQTVRNPKVRRWDQSGTEVSNTVPGGDVLIQESTPIDLEGGVQVIFETGGNYMTGDYWLVPARTVTGDVDWPHDSSGNPQFRPAQGITHHFSPLGIVNFGAAAWTVTSDCRRLFAPLADNGIHITTVFLSNPTGLSPNGAAILNDAAVALQDLAGGISIVCDTPIDLVSLSMANPSFSPIKPLSKPTCFVTIEVPNLAAAGHLPFAAQPMIVAAGLTLDITGTIISWTPTADAITWIQNQLSQILGQTPAPAPMLGHLTLKGNYIWAAGNPSLFLDGETFGAPDASGNQRTGLFLPSGDGRRGGDFEMWFWLISLPSIVVSPTSIDFGPLAVGTPSPAVPVTLTNNTKNPVTIAVALNPASPADFAQTTTCPATPATLAAGANCTLNVTFTPTASGLRAAAITVTPSPGTALNIPLTGTGLAPSLQASATTLRFSAVLGLSVSQILTLTNTGSAPLTISSIIKSGAAANDYSFSGPCVPAAAPTVLQPGASCSITVTFTPSVAGQRQASLTITHDSNLTLPITLVGTGIPFKSGGGGVTGGGLPFIGGIRPPILLQ